jgi:hypothetical protein
MIAIKNATPIAKYPTTSIGTANLALASTAKIEINAASTPAVASPTGAMKITGVITRSNWFPVYTNTVNTTTAVTNVHATPIHHSTYATSVNACPPQRAVLTCDAVSAAIVISAIGGMAYEPSSSASESARRTATCGYRIQRAMVRMLKRANKTISKT